MMWVSRLPHTHTHSVTGVELGVVFLWRLVCGCLWLFSAVHTSLWLQLLVASPPSHTPPLPC